MKKFFLLTMIGALLSSTSCNDDDNITSVQPVSIILSVTHPEDIDPATISDETLTLKNRTTGEETTTSNLSDIKIIPGLYDINYTASATLPSGAIGMLLGAKIGVTVEGTQNLIELSTYQMIPTDDLIIAEIFFTGTQQPSGTQYRGDDYIKLYNNTDHIVYADGLTLFESKLNTTERIDHTPNIINTDISVQILYTVPGIGMERPVNPGEYLLIADTGIDHRDANPNSFDLSHADFEWYDQSSSATAIDIDNSDVPNLDKWYSYTKSYFILHNRGFKAYGIARIPIDKDTYINDYKYTYNYTLVTAAGEFPMSTDAYRIPNEWVIDVVNCSIEAKYAWNVTASELDCGWTYCGTIDQDKTRFFKSVRRKVQLIEPSGRVVLKDTNNSSDDFNPECIPSEIELQSTAISAAGDKATTVTYDGVMPKI